MAHVKKSLRLYHAAESICSERVLMTLYEKHIVDWVDCPMLLFEDEQYTVIDFMFFIFIYFYYILL